MNKTFLNKKAQSTMEYALIVACVCGALFIMQNYIKRSFMGRMKQASNEISSDLYDMNKTNTNITYVLKAEYASETQTVILGNDTDGFPIVGFTSSTTGTETSIRSGNEKISEK